MANNVTLDTFFFKFISLVASRSASAISVLVTTSSKPHRLLITKTFLLLNGSFEVTKLGSD